ncbi:hypothetical protein RvY_15501 [Ramazzottius varieornatus]|uniref:GATOR complex protein NPRL3 n=1 Tax=Ramazzottius varieornatus TaxID=947166 RepID=A0A1D1VYD5_RAMVA|nr:hypothetical protein RvY_15501 [Ramazzottius varieornatus]
MSFSILDPLGVFFSISGAKGERLLFRYPFEILEGRKTRGANPYSLIVTEDIKNRSSNAENTVDSKRCSRSSSMVDDVGVPSGAQRLRSFSDKTLAHIFAFNIKTPLYNKKFVVKIDDVVFVGHPMHITAGINLRALREIPANVDKPPQDPLQRPSHTGSSISMFHIVFALRAEDVSHFVIDFYHKLSLKLALAINHEEQRDDFLQKQVKGLTSTIEEVAESNRKGGHSPVSPYGVALGKNQLAILLQRVYDDIVREGRTSVRVNNWINVSFCLLPKIHRDVELSEAALSEHIRRMKPYHGLLLLSSEQEIASDLPIDASSGLLRFLRIVSPLCNFQQLAMEAGTTLNQVFAMAGHLIYWAKARLIFPVCETNVYAISPNASIKVLSDNVEEFHQKFSDPSLLEILSDFSMPQPLRDVVPPFSDNMDTGKLTQIVIWCLKKELLMQLHTYVCLIPPDVKDLRYLRNDKLDWMSLPYEVKDKVMLNPLLKDEQQQADFTAFMKLVPHLRGKVHLEEIMFDLNLKRSQLIIILDKFRDVLVHAAHEDPNLQCFDKRNVP